jgi:hypothetical protein
MQQLFRSGSHAISNLIYVTLLGVADCRRILDCRVKPGNDRVPKTALANTYGPESSISASLRRCRSKPILSALLP